MFVFLLNPWTTGAAFAVSGTSSQTYEKSAREYVVTSNRSVEALCEPGDSFVKGSCNGVNALQAPADDRGPAVFLDSAEMNTVDKLGWACSVRLVHPAQIIRVESKVTCMKGAKVVLAK